MNTNAHHQLIELGFTYTAVEADWYDGGDCENGPKLEGGPAYDLYENDALALRIYVAENGSATVEERDMAAEAEEAFFWGTVAADRAWRDAVDESLEREWLEDRQ